MSELTSETYPNDGKDWIDPAALAREVVWGNAETEEAFTHQAAEVRRHFFSKLLAYNALGEGSGWAMFIDEPEGSVAEVGTREVLLRSTIYINERGVHCIPVVRIITNEEIINGTEYVFLSEDITIMPTGEAAYHMSTVQLEENDTEGNTTTLRKSSIPLFSVSDGELVIAGGVPEITPVLAVDCDLDPNVTVIPFGDPTSSSQQFYALEKAEGILQSIASLMPRYQKEK